MTIPARRASINAPTVLLREVDTPYGIRRQPANELAKALAEAFSVEYFSEACADRLRRAGLNVEFYEPQPVYRLLRNVP